MRAPTKSAQHGFSIPSAIFVLVVITMLGAAMVRVVGLGQESVAREVVSIRALMAAESGAERGLHRVLTEDDSACSDNLPNFGELFGGAWSISAVGLQGCEARVSCSKTAVDIDDIAPVEVFYTIRSEGRCGPVNSQSVRIVEVQAY